MGGSGSLALPSPQLGALVAGREGEETPWEQKGPVSVTQGSGR